MIRTGLIEGVAAVAPAAWDALVGPEGSPFLEHAFLRAVEAASATREHGVLPAHVVALEGDALIGALPLYVKGDGRGEFAYDWTWEVLAARAGREWYPKGVSMAPFSPIEGSRLLVAPGADRAAVEVALLERAEAWGREVGLSGLHALFLPEPEAERLAARGWLRRLGFQLGWTRRGETRLDDLLARFRSRERVKIKREMRRLGEAGLRLEVVEGDAIGEEHRDALWEVWTDTCERHGTGSQYIQRASWDELFATWRRRLLLFCARGPRGIEAGSLCVHKGGDVWGRYWGARRRVSGLYFDLTMYRPLELLIERGWRRFHLGAGQADYKLARGFEPVPAHGAHLVFDPAVRRMVERQLAVERPAVAAEMARIANEAELAR